jgi:hypothetical protein
MWVMRLPYKSSALFQSFPSCRLQFFFAFDTRYVRTFFFRFVSSTPSNGEGFASSSYFRPPRWCSYYGTLAIVVCRYVSLGYVKQKVSAATVGEQYRIVDDRQRAEELLIKKQRSLFYVLPLLVKSLGDFS